MWSAFYPMRQLQVLCSPMRRCSPGYVKVAAMPDAALKPRAMLSVASVMPRHLRTCNPGEHGQA